MATRVSLGFADGSAVSAVWSGKATSVAPRQEFLDGEQSSNLSEDLRSSVPLGGTRGVGWLVWFFSEKEVAERAGHTVAWEARLPLVLGCLPESRESE